jgi:hypothetical protein
MVTQFSVRGQSSFLNLNFEAATLSPLPIGQNGSHVPFTSALPGWTGYLGSIQANTALQNNVTLGAPSINILGPLAWNYNPFGPSAIDGNYAVMLQSGSDVAGLVDTSIAQIGMVPATAQSLLFKAFAIREFSVSLGGQALSLVTVNSTTNYSVFAADISSFAGQTAELRFTAIFGNSRPGFLTLDSIMFSPTPVPEPSAFIFIGVGGLIFGARNWRKYRRLSKNAEP